MKIPFALITLVFTIQLHAQNNTQLPERKIPVTIQPLSELLVERQLRSLAQVVSQNHSTLSAQIPAQVQEVFADIGEVKKAGELLLQLDDVDYDLALQEAQSNLSSNQARTKQAELRLQRAKNLIKKSYIAEDDLLARETDLSVLKAERIRLKVLLQQANRNKNKTKVRAPFDGVILNRQAQKGSYVATGMALFDFVQTSDAQIEAQIPSHLSVSLNEANRFYFKSGEVQQDVTLIRLSPVIESGKRVQKARFQIPVSSIPIGTTGELIWEINDGLLPADLVVKRNGVLGVFIAENNKAQFKQLVNAQEGRPVVVKLPLDSLIIVGGRERLQDNSAIDPN